MKVNPKCEQASKEQRAKESEAKEKLAGVLGKIKAVYADNQTAIKGLKEKQSEALRTAVECGKLLTEAKALFEQTAKACFRTSFKKWLKKDCPQISNETAYRYMRLAESVSRINIRTAEKQLEQAGNLYQAYVAFGILKDQNKTRRVSTDTGKAPASTTTAAGSGSSSNPHAVETSEAANALLRDLRTMAKNKDGKVASTIAKPIAELYYANAPAEETIETACGNDPKAIASALMKHLEHSEGFEGNLPDLLEAVRPIHAWYLKHAEMDFELNGGQSALGEEPKLESETLKAAA